MDSDGIENENCEPETDDPFYPVYKELRKNGACKICSYRFLCNSENNLSLDELLVTVS